MEANHRLIGCCIAKYREAKGLKQKDLADIIGIGRTTLSDIESGRKKAGINLLIRISDALNISLSGLLDDNVTHSSFAETENETIRELEKCLNGSSIHQKEVLRSLVEEYLTITQTTDFD